MQFLLMTICVLGLAVTLTRGDNPCPCEATTATPTTTPCGCNCGGDGSGSDGSWNQGVNHYWPFDNDMNDRVGSANVLTCIGDWQYDFDRLQNENGSLKFTDAVCVLPAGIYFSGPFTIAMWVNIPDSVNSTTTLIQFTYNTASDGVSIAVSFDNNGVPLANLVLESGLDIIVEVFGQTQISLNDWTHITATFDGMSAKLYVNGDFDHEQNISEPFFPAFRDANCFGGVTGAGIVTIATSFDDVRIYGRDLTAEEVTELYNSPNQAPSNENEENNGPVKCNDIPLGYCSKTCSAAYPEYIHHGSDSECGLSEVCCAETPDDSVINNACKDAGAFCVQKDSCRVQDLIYVDGCDQGSVFGVCCSTTHYYGVHNDPFNIMDHNGTQCYGTNLGCSVGVDCCSFNCMIDTCQ